MAKLILPATTKEPETKEKPWTPEAQLKIERGLNTAQIEDSRRGLTGSQTQELLEYLEKQYPKQPTTARQKEPTKKEPTKPKTPPTPTPPGKDLTIERIPYPKWWRDSLNAKIDLTAPGSQVLATVTGRLTLYVATIVLTVTGETAISFNFGNAGSSGPLYLGGVDQPKGIVIAMGNSPAPCGDRNLIITATDPNGEEPSIGGWATCFVEETKERKQ